MSCAGSGYLTQNTLVAFPFADDQCLEWQQEEMRAEAQIALQKCFADASICLKSTSVNEYDWPRIGSFRSLGTSISFVLKACGSSVSLSVSSSESKFPIVSGSAAFGSYVIVMCSDAIREFCESGFTAPVAAGYSDKEISEISVEQGFKIQKVNSKQM